MILKGKSWKNDDIFYLSLEDYPSDKLGYVLDKLSCDNQSYKAPNDKSPLCCWEWRYLSNIWPAIEIIIFKNDIELTFAEGAL